MYLVMSGVAVTVNNISSENMVIAKHSKDENSVAH